MKRHHPANTNCKYEVVSFIIILIDVYTQISLHDDMLQHFRFCFISAVLVFGLGAYFLDGAAFIKQICRAVVYTALCLATHLLRPLLPRPPATAMQW